MSNPQLIPQPFANIGNKNTIQNTRQTGQPDQDATWSEGFPPVTMLPLGSGGLPPNGGDFNGILFGVTQAIVHQQNGGMYYFDADYAVVIGGYPVGSVLMSDDNLKSFVSTSNGNFNNPNSNVSGWQVFASAAVNPAFIGIPFAFPLASTPSGWVNFAGQVINPTTNPKLASIYGANMPDLRGVSIRGWDNGRGLDSEPSRALLSYQTDTLQNATGVMGNVLRTQPLSGSGVFQDHGYSTYQLQIASGLTVYGNGFDFNLSNVARTSAETRMKNIAFNYITPQG